MHVRVTQTCQTCFISVCLLSDELEREWALYTANVYGTVEGLSYNKINIAHIESRKQP